MSRSEDTYLDACRQEIESRLQWGPADEWVTADFEDLSDRIANETGRTLGATTLKRVWGRVRYDSSPSRHTLDTLALFVGAGSWREFQGLHHDGLSESDAFKEPAMPGLASTREAEASPTRRWTGLAAAVILVSVVMIWMIRDGRDLVADPTQVNVSFASRTVSEGLPNSVVFDYQLSGVAGDSFFIQQSWDARLRDRIDPSQSQFTSIYYYPGHFRAKLIADTLVLREHLLTVPTDGWDILIERDRPAPIYAEPIPTDGDVGLRLDPDWMLGSVPDLLEGGRAMNVFVVGQFDPLPSQSAVLRTRIRLDVNPAFAACQAATINLMATTGWISIPFARTGCSSGMNMTAGDKQISGQTNDLSSLGVDLSSWTDVVIAVRDRLVFIEINDEPVYQAAYSREIGDIIGVRYRFEGSGMIETAVLENELGENVLPALVQPPA